jgi:hypothetical protein
MIETTISKNSFYSKYPVLKINTYGTVVLFNAENIGMVVRAGGKSFTVGHYTTDWCEAYFTECNDAITLENK